MKTPEKPIDEILDALKERAKELNCLYAVDELLCRLEEPVQDILTDLVRSLPDGWQYPEVCEAVVAIDEKTYRSNEFEPTSWFQQADILVEHQKIGEITVYYTSEKPTADEGPFLLLSGNPPGGAETSGEQQDEAAQRYAEAADL